MVKGGLSGRTRNNKYVETPAEPAWQAASGRRKPFAGTTRKNPDGTQIYASLSEMRQSFDNRSL